MNKQEHLMAALTGEERSLLLNALNHELTEYRHILKTPDLPARLHTQIAHQHRLVTKLSDVLEGTL